MKTDNLLFLFSNYQKIYVLANLSNTIQTVNLNNNICLVCNYLGPFDSIYIICLLFIILILIYVIILFLKIVAGCSNFPFTFTISNYQYFKFVINNFALFHYNLMTQQIGQLSKVKIDLIVIGNPNSGKTSLIRRFIDGQTSFNQFYTPTLGLTLEKKVILVDNHEVTVCIWDTAGQQKFFSLTKNYFKKADGVIVVFDLTDKMSFDRVDKFWVPQIKEKSDENCAQILVGNKKDMVGERAITSQNAKAMADSLKIPYFQTSAKTGEYVQQAIQSLVKECICRVKTEQEMGIQLKAPSGQGSGGGCISAFKQFFSGFKERFS